MSRRDPDPEDRRKHLELVQSVISRMSGASSTSKSWLLPVVTAAYGYAIVQEQTSVAVLGIASVIIFGVLDAHYLRQERAFRALFRAAVQGRVQVFEMSPAPYFRRPNGDEDDERDENCRWGKIIWSWALAGFYLPFALTGLVIVGAIGA